MRMKGTILGALLFLAILFARAQAPDRPLRAIGEFTNIRATEGHAYGYTVDLWRDGNSVVGFFYCAAGLEGDTPVGKLESVNFRPRTGQLTFTAKLSTGVTLLPNGAQQPSHDLFQFTGTLKSNTLTGTLTRSPSSERETVALTLRANEALPATRTYRDWQNYATDLLKARGPRW